MNIHIFVDGSAFLGDLSRLKRRPWSSQLPDDPDEKKKEAERVMREKWEQMRSRPARIDRLASFLHRVYKTRGVIRRTSFYFVVGDSRVDHDDEGKRLVWIPSPTAPNALRDVHIARCGSRITDRAKADRWLDQRNAPQYVRDLCHRFEKAVDTQICCDVLSLAASGNADRVGLYANDLDFLPLVIALRQMGVNTDIIRLYRDEPDTPNKDLVEAADGFLVPTPGEIDRLFEPP